MYNSKYRIYVTRYPRQKFGNMK